MTIGLFIPCYIDQLYPNVGIASLQLLEKLKLSVKVLESPLCCGQPMANAGFERLGTSNINRLETQLSDFDYIVTPSGSCTLHMKEQLHNNERSARLVELTEFLTDRLQLDKIPARFPHRVGLHQSCHGLRGLGLGRPSEIMGRPFSKPATLLNLVAGLQLVPLQQTDECCGFGGTFAVTEDAVSVKMGHDRLRDHVEHGAEVITGVDMSCLMHLDGLIRKRALPLRVLHIAEILNVGW